MRKFQVRQEYSERTMMSLDWQWLEAFIRQNCSVRISDNFVYKIFRIYGLRAETKHRTKYTRRKIRDKYPNLIFTTWETVDRPKQVIVSDMTAFWANYTYWELTMYFDVFTKQILSWSLSYKRGDRRTYINGLKDLLELLDGVPDAEHITVIHTDQGSVYASVAYNKLITDPNIKRSMSRAGKPTDNPVNESLNGWIKEELFLDFNLDKSDDIPQTIAKYINFYNEMRPCYALGYDIPNHYEQRYWNGELEKKDTFRNRVLSETPKFVQKKMSTSKNESEEITQELSSLSNLHRKILSHVRRLYMFALRMRSSNFLSSGISIALPLLRFTRSFLKITTRLE